MKFDHRPINLLASCKMSKLRRKSYLQIYILPTSKSRCELFEMLPRIESIKYIRGLGGPWPKDVYRFWPYYFSKRNSKR